MIKHAVTREVAYASIPKARRAHLHAAFAELGRAVRGRRDEYAAILAHHYAEAASPRDADLAWSGEADRLRELRQRAIEWLRRAGELAIGRYEIEEGLALLTKAVELGPDRATESAIWHEIGRAHALKYDGEPFWAAMQKAIELSDDPAASADMYSDLARETVLRVGMWRQAPDPALIEEWIGRALELAPEEGPTRVKALVARALWGGTAQDAAEAAAIAERVGDPNLRFAALTIQSSVAFRARDYEQSLVWADRAFELTGTVSDHELVADPDLSAVWPALALGRFEQARQHGARVYDMNLNLTSHHRVHAVAVPLEVEELLGDWGRIRAMRAEAEAAVEANLETPCVRNPRSMLVCALAEEIGGDPAAADALLARAEELRMEGHGLVLAGPARAARADPRRPRRRRAPPRPGRPRRQAAHRLPPRAHLDPARRARRPPGPGAGRGGGARAAHTGHVPRAVRAARARDRPRGRGARRAGAGALRCDGPGLARGANRAAPGPALESDGMRICSLLPSATEIVADLGLVDSLVGVSDECRWPAEVVGKPVVSAARIDPAALSSAEIDAAVRDSLRDGGSLYVVDADLIAELDPDLIVTQDLCAVCAVSEAQLGEICPVGVEVLSLDPRTLGEVAESVRTLSARLDVRVARRARSSSGCRRRSTRLRPRCTGSRGAACSLPSGSTRRSAPVTGCRR